MSWHKDVGSRKRSQALNRVKIKHSQKSTKIYAHLGPLSLGSNRQMIEQLQAAQKEECQFYVAAS